VILLACLVPLVQAPMAAARAVAEEDSEIELASGTVMLGTEKVAEVKTQGEYTLVYLKRGSEEPDLKEGRSLVLPASEEPGNPKGAFGKIFKLSSAGGQIEIKLKPEPLGDAYTEFDLEVRGETVDELEAESKEFATPEPAEESSLPKPEHPGILDNLVRAYSCNGNKEAKAALEAKLGQLKPYIRISLKRKEFDFELIGRPEFTGSFEAYGAAECELAHPPTLSIPVFHAPPVFLEFKPVATAKLSGTLKSSFTWSPKIKIGERKVEETETEPVEGLERETLEFPELTAEGGVEADLGLKVGLSLAKTISVSGTVGPNLKYEFHPLPPPACHNATISGFAELTGEVNLFVRHWTVSLVREKFLSREFPEGVECPRGSETHGSSAPVPEQLLGAF
jgi:hypothetical protein